MDEPQRFIAALRDVLKYLGDEQSKEARRRGPVQLQFFLRVWERGWVKFWMTELFRDLFGMYTLGPAFAWSHLHLVAKRGANPFEVPLSTLSSHPADDARMRTMLYALQIAGFADESSEILSHWQSFLEESGARPEPEYHRCYPDTVLQMIAQHAKRGLLSTQIRVATPQTCEPVHTLLNQAWRMFWSAPDSYVSWEKKAVADLFESFEHKKS